MNEFRRLHPVYIVFAMGGLIRNFLPLIVIIFIRGLREVQPADLLHWSWIAGIVGFGLLAAVYGFLQWRTFEFFLKEDCIVIRNGLFFREEKTIYYLRIHSVNLDQPFSQRLLGLAQLKIETPGGIKSGDGVLYVLSLPDALDVQKQLLARQEDESDQGEVPQAQTTYAAQQELAELSQGQPKQTAAHGQANRIRTTAYGQTNGIRITALELFCAAATSLNLGLAIAFIFGIYSFADDFFETLLPDHFFENMVGQSVYPLSLPLFVVIGVLIAVFMVWFLSLVLYVIKYSGFSVKRVHQKISLSYGLFEKKTVVFDPESVQAVIVNENLLRQPFGYAEVKLQVVTSQQQEQLMLHPFLKYTDIQSLLDAFIPGFDTAWDGNVGRAPSQALLYYLRVPLLIASLIVVGAIYWLGAIGIWSLLLLPVVAAWRFACQRTASIRLTDQQLSIRRRMIQRSTLLIAQSRIVVMKVKASRGQRRRELTSLAVYVLGTYSDFGVYCLKRQDVEAVWNWFSRHKQILSKHY